ncbi:universal stress protein [Streptomyces sp. NPDC050085]|uniref:universal stress protein n=1 Tax=Streptomyces sp. NPDC050085 TaxID=3365600 RepID=UPI003794F723
MTEFAQGIAQPRIVVGVDGSPASVAALRWAMGQARALHARVLAVHAWQDPARGFAPYAPTSRRPTPAQERGRATRTLAVTVRAACGRSGAADVGTLVVEGPACRVLLQHARGALLLALGSRSPRDGESPTLGAVSRECLRHADVPVVTVPASTLSKADLAPAIPRAAHAPAENQEDRRSHAVRVTRNPVTSPKAVSRA